MHSYVLSFAAESLRNRSGRRAGRYQSVRGREFAAALPLKALGSVLGWLQAAAAPKGLLLIYWLPLALIPVGLGLLALPNPLVRAERFQPTPWRCFLTTACLAGAVLFFAGVDTFIYANF